MTDPNVNQVDSMTWMTVDEAAAVLGVSDRTILRRVKAGIIESREVDGRTEVRFEHIEKIEPSNGPSRELSRVETARLSRIAAAQLHMRRLDADAISDALAVLSDYRLSFDDQITRARRATRGALGLAAVLLIALGGAAWYHATTVAALRQKEIVAVNDLALTHQEQTSQLAVEHEQAIAEFRTQSAHAQGLSDARANEVERIRETVNEREQRLIEADQAREALRTKMDEQVASFQTLLNTGEASREQLQSGWKEQLGTAQATVAQQSAAIESRDEEIATLRQQVAKLSDEIDNKARTYQTLREQSEKITAAVRRSAARSIGMAEGMRLHIAEQRETLRQLREQLAQTQAALAAPTKQAEQQRDHRQAIWNSVIGKEDCDDPDEHDDETRPNDASTATEGADAKASTDRWKALLTTCFQHWALGPSAELADKGGD